MIGSLMSSILLVCKKIFKWLFSIGFFSAIVILTIIGVGITLALLKIAPVASFLSPLSGTQTNIALIAFIALIIIPILASAMFIGRWFYPNKLKSQNLNLGITWLVSLVVCIVFASKIGEVYTSTNTTSNLISLKDQIKSKKISLDFDDVDYTRGTINFGDIVIQDAKTNFLKNGFNKTINSIDVRYLDHIQIEKAENNELAILEQRRFVDGVELGNDWFTVKDNSLHFDGVKTVEKPNKYYGEKVEYKIYLPKGYEIKYDSKHRNIVWYGDDLQGNEEGEVFTVSY
jgi:hypothetical protein